MVRFSEKYGAMCTASMRAVPYYAVQVLSSSMRGYNRRNKHCQLIRENKYIINES